MPSSISNSNYKAKTISFLLFAVGWYLMATLACYLYEGLQIKHSEHFHAFANDVEGKNGLMKYFYSKERPDIVFVGSSTTKDHISTYAFKKQGMRVFNFGLEGHSYPQYPEMIKHAIALKPKIIAISLNQFELYLSLDFYYQAFAHNDLTFYDLRFLAKNAKTRDMRNYLWRLTLDYLHDLSYFSGKGYKIRNSLLSAYNGEFSYSTMLGYNNTQDSNVKIDCDYDVIGKPTIGSSCMNGDAALEGQEKTLTFENFNKIEEGELTHLNPQIVAMLNGFFKQIRKAGIKPVLVFIPDFSRHASDMANVKARLNADVIDLSNDRLPKDAWFNTGHFNALGRQIYSRKLAHEFLKYS